MASIKSQIAEAMIDELEDHTWVTTTPAEVFNGPIPAGNLAYPCVSVFTGIGGSIINTGIGYDDIVDDFLWSIGQVLTLDTLENQYEEHLEWQDEVRKLARTAVDQFWGLGGTVRSNLLKSWELSLMEIPLVEGGVEHVLSTTFIMEVEYRESL